ncbi:hypothetical protein, partial [Streptococcus pneumoniae]|uniref:hypothetical protein n=1 Tax=Streptococcus pneumoniae TaxID=1313 RepID=UPI001E52C740
MAGSLTLSSTMTVSVTGSNSLSFTGTSGTQTLNTNGITLDFNITQSGVGGTMQLSNNLVTGSTRTLT